MDSDSTMWVIIGVVLLLLFFLVLLVAVGLAIFFISNHQITLALNGNDKWKSAAAQFVGFIDTGRSVYYLRQEAFILEFSGRNSMVECQLPKLKVASSILVARSILPSNF